MKSKRNNLLFMKKTNKKTLAIIKFNKWKKIKLFVCLKLII